MANTNSCVCVCVNVCVCVVLSTWLLINLHGLEPNCF